ncbi:MAG: hypothetical protein JXR70_06545 [Spirochaetales bacterium]|nr:hypothetical protein [Spirochaetales bacterium]
MNINFDINETLKDKIIKGRTSFYVWKDLDQLKSYYSDVVDGDLINQIANEVKSRNTMAFQFREGVDEHLNERGLCNLVEIELLNHEAALDKFLEKPVYGTPEKKL